MSTTCRLLTGTVFLGCSIQAAAQGQGSWGGGSGLVSAIALLLLLGLAAICVATGFVGRRFGRSSRQKLLFAMVGGLAPVMAIAIWSVNLNRNDKEARAALIDTNEAVIRVAQAHIDRTCADLQALEKRTVDLQRSVQRRLIKRSTVFHVPPSEMDWPLPMNRVSLAFDAADQKELQSMRFEESYFDRQRVHDMSEQLDYVEHIEEDGQIYALGKVAHWQTLVPRLDDESKRELTGFLSQRAAHDVTGFRPKKSLARHVLEVSDVSTREDRNHWTARLRAKVFDATSGEELFNIERLLPIMIEWGRNVGGVRLCARKQNDAVAKDRNFDWLGYLVREMSAEPNK
jgi:hypothetical protein